MPLFLYSPKEPGLVIGVNNSSTEHWINISLKITTISRELI